MTHALEIRQETETRHVLEANEMKVLKKIVEKKKIIEKEANRLENSAVSKQVRSGWKGEKENGTIM